jgi:hypothetical protein
MIHSRDDYQYIQDPTGRIPDSEPVFLLRGQDPAAPFAIRSYAQKIELLGADKAMVRHCVAQADAMEGYQDELDNVHIPDLFEGTVDAPPVPVATEPDSDPILFPEIEVLPQDDLGRLSLLLKLPAGAPTDELDKIFNSLPANTGAIFDREKGRLQLRVFLHDCADDVNPDEEEARAAAESETMTQPKDGKTGTDA